MNDDKKDYLTKAIDEAKKWETFYQQIVEELRTEERYRNYFSQFSPDSVEGFISYYATQKVNWFRYSNVHANWEKRKSEKWYEIARGLIASIQRNKVLHLIARWGNYEIKVPEAKSFYDFEKWIYNPFICPYIEPVQMHEIETTQRFIHTLGDERVTYLELSHASVHTLLILGDPDHTPDCYDYPLFFRYLDREYGLEHLKAKAPERMRKEQDYVWGYRNHLKQQQPPAKPVASDEKLRLNHWERPVMDKFIAACETPKFKRMYKMKRWWDNRNDFGELAERELDDLSGSPSHLPIESNDDWREAIVNTAEQYDRQQVLECLPLAYKEYVERLKQEKPFTDWAKEDKYPRSEAWYEKYLTELLAGRKLMNEPEDFNF